MTHHQRHTNPFISYRPDIDGLRCVAVLAVLLFHAFPEEFHGGFVGVDIFFVISGYLISTILFRQLETDRFSYWQFIQRRIRRILPSLLLVTAGAGAFGWLVLYPHEFQQLGKHIAGGNAFAANLVLWKESGYFDTTSESKPLLHLWSLGVEEQFYILWPLTLALLWRRHHAFLGLTVVVGLASFCLNLWSTYTQTPATAFYLPYNRFWEMMIGGLLAHITLHRTTWLPKSSTANNRLAWTGAILIASGMLLIKPLGRFPGFWALLPTCGTAFVLMSPTSWLNQSLLAHRTPVYIGLISYALYMWHWPLLVFAGIMDLDSDLEKTLTLAVAGLLAWISYEWVEKPIRELNAKLVIPGLLGSSLALLILGLGAQSESFTSRNNSPGATRVVEAIRQESPLNGLEPAELNGVCILKKIGSSEQVLFYGDSHMEHFAPRITQLISDDPKNTRTAIFATFPGCPPIPGVFEDQHPECNDEIRSAVLSLALSPDIHSVVIAFSSAYFFPSRSEYNDRGYRYYWRQNEQVVFFEEGGSGLALESLEEMVRNLASQKPVYLIVDNPIGTAFDPKHYLKGGRIRGGSFTPPPAVVPYNPDQAELRQQLLNIASQTGAIPIDIPAAMLREGMCPVVTDEGEFIYRDAGHLRSFYTKEHLSVLDVIVRSPHTAMDLAPQI